MKKQEVISIINAMRFEAEALECDPLVSMAEGVCNQRISHLLRKYADELDGALGRYYKKFTPARKSYLEGFSLDDIEIRRLEENDEYYYPGMWGMFEKATGKLLRRHNDKGSLLITLG